MSSSAGPGPRGPTSSRERPQKAPRCLTDAELLSVVLFPFGALTLLRHIGKPAAVPQRDGLDDTGGDEPGHLDVNVSCGIDFMFSGRIICASQA